MSLHDGWSVSAPGYFDGGAGTLPTICALIHLDNPFQLIFSGFGAGFRGPGVYLHVYVQGFQN